MTIYNTLRQKANWNKTKIVEHKDISPNERLMLDCAHTYYHAFWSEDGIKLTKELNNPNFLEIVDNCKNALPYNTKHDRASSGNNGS